MRLSSNIMRFHNVFSINGTINVFKEAGIEAIDFNNDIAEYHDQTHGKDFYTELRKYANDLGLIFGQTHAPFASSYPDEEKTKQRFDEIVTSIKYSSYLGAPYIVVHPCQHIEYTDENAKALYEYNVNFYKRLIPYSEEYGVKIAIENINYQGKEGIISTPEKLNRLYDELKNDAFVVCFDVGHMNILGIDPADAIRKVGSRIKCLHVHDNDGKGDIHTLPYYGTIGWDGVAKALADIGYDGTFNYEASGFISDIPKELYLDGAKYMSVVGHHIIDRIEYYKDAR